MLKSAGGQGKPTVFLLTDSQIKEESFLEDVDSLLNTGEVPNLFAVDEKAELIEVSEAVLEWLLSMVHLAYFKCNSTMLFCRKGYMKISKFRKFPGKLLGWVSISRKAEDLLPAVYLHKGGYCSCSAWNFTTFFLPNIFLQKYSERLQNVY